MKRRREGSRYQRVVDGWADLTAWPTAKKTALAMAIASPLHLAVGLCGVAALSLSPELVDLPRFVRMNATLVAITMMLFLVTLPAARRGKEARWTVYLVIVVYGSCLTWVIWLFGAASTPLYGLAPLVVLLVLVYWDPRAGRFALAFMLVGVVTVSYLELSGRVAHAPLLLRRTFDAQQTLGWYLVVSLYLLTALGYVFILVDFSESTRKRQQRRLEETHRELQAVSRHKSEFLANMSHELRTPLNAVIGFSEVLQVRMFGPLNEKQAEYVQDILHSGRHLLSLINDILDLAKIEAGRADVEASLFDLTAAIDNALVLTKERAVRRGLRLERNLDPQLGRIYADERKVKQVLINLLSNAVKFTPEGGTITVSATRGPAVVTLVVQDTGIGIAAEDQELIFEEFRQVGNDYTRKQEGTGLGLALARRLVVLHGGRLWVESALGNGSTFSFTLPLKSPESPSRVAVGAS